MTRRPPLVIGYLVANLVIYLVSASLAWTWSPSSWPWWVTAFWYLEMFGLACCVYMALMPRKP